MPGFTNKGKAMILGVAFRGVAVETNYYIALCTSAVTPDADTNLLSDLQSISSGNGYTVGGYSLTPGVTDFDVLTEDDANDRGHLETKDIVWTASGGSIPASGGGARWAVLTDDNVTVANREVYLFWDLVSDRTVSDGQPLTLEDCPIRINET